MRKSLKILKAWDVSRRKDNRARDTLGSCGLNRRARWSLEWRVDYANRCIRDRSFERGIVRH